VCIANKLAVRGNRSWISITPMDPRGEQIPEFARSQNWLADMLLPLTKQNRILVHNRNL